MAGSWKGFLWSLWHPAADAHINPSSRPSTIILPQPSCLSHQRWPVSLSEALMKIYKAGWLLPFQSFPKIKCILQPQGLSDTWQGLDTYMLWLEIIRVFLEENFINSKRWTKPPDSVYSVNFGRLKTWFTWTLPGSLAHLQGLLCSQDPRYVSSAFKTCCLEIVIHGAKPKVLKFLI